MNENNSIILKPIELQEIDDEYISWYKNDDGLLNTFTSSRREFNRESILDDFMQGENSGRWYYLMIIDKKTNKKIGNVKIGPIDIINKTSDLVCLIGDRAFHGKGLAKIAIAMASELAFQKYDIRKLHGGMYENNIAAIKAYTSAGWVVEGRLKGHYWVNGKSVDRILVACFNPAYFGIENIDC